MTRKTSMENSKKFHCPRCNNKSTYFMNEIISCPVCKLSFNKNMLELFKDENILSNEELIAIMDIFKKKEVDYISENCE